MSFRPLTPFGALAWTVAATTTAGFLVAMGALALRHASPVLALSAALETVGYATFIWLAVQDSRGPPRLVLGLARPALSLLLVGSALGVALHGPCAALSDFVDRVWTLPEAEVMARLERLRPEGGVERALLLVGVAGAVPVVEELFYRGVLHARLRIAATPWVAGLTTTMLFTLSHLDPRSFLPLLPVAAALAVLRSASASVVPGVLLHAAFNATTLLVAFSSVPAELARAPSPPLAALVGVAASTLLLAAAAWLGRREAR